MESNINKISKLNDTKILKLNSESKEDINLRASNKYGFNSNDQGNNSLINSIEVHSNRDFQLSGYKSDSEANRTLQNKLKYEISESSTIAYENIELDDKTNHSKESINDKEIKVHEIVEDNEIRNYNKYGIFPSLLATHLALVVLLVTHLYSTISDFRLEKAHHKFINNVHNFKDLSDRNPILILTINDLKNHLTNTLDKIFSYEKLIIEELKFTQKPNTLKVYPKKHNMILPMDYIIKDTPPFTDFINLSSQEIREMMKNIEAIEIKAVYEVIFQLELNRPLCLEFTNYYIYDISQRGAIEFDLINSPQLCKNFYLESQLLIKSQIIIIFVVLMSIFELCLVVLRINKIAKIWILLERNQTYSEKLQELSLSDKIYFVNFGLIAIAISDIFLIISFGSYIFTFGIPIFLSFILMIFGSILSFFCMGYFLISENKYSTFYRVFKESIGFLIKAVFLIALFFVGISLLCITIFYHSPYFRNISSTIRALLAIMFNDSVYEIYESALIDNPISILILISFQALFWILFVTLILRMLINLVSSNYHFIHFVKENKDEHMTLQKFFESELNDINKPNEEIQTQMLIALNHLGLISSLNAPQNLKDLNENYIEKLKNLDSIQNSNINPLPNYSYDNSTIENNQTNKLSTLANATFKKNSNNKLNLNNYDITETKYYDINSNVDLIATKQFLKNKLYNDYKQQVAAINSKIVFSEILMGDLDYNSFYLKAFSKLNSELQNEVNELRQLVIKNNKNVKIIKKTELSIFISDMSKKMLNKVRNVISI